MKWGREGVAKSARARQRRANHFEVYFSVVAFVMDSRSGNALSTTETSSLIICNFLIPGK